jgi:hypothetical protein
MEENTKPPETAAPDNKAVMETLQQLSAKVDDMRTRVASIEQEHARNSNQSHEAIREGETRKSSRLVLTTLFAGIGAKLGFVTGLKLAAVEHARNSMGTGGTFWQRVKEFNWEKFLNASEAVKGKGRLIKTFKLTAIPTAIGTALGITIGWLRGDRIKEPKDILEHPIETIKKLIMTEKSYQAKLEKENPVGQANPEKWQDKVRNSRQLLHLGK